MATVTRLMLDVLKAHEPNALIFASEIADAGENYHVNLWVQEVDNKTHSIVLKISGANLDYEVINHKIESMGATVHSIDEVDVHSEPLSPDISSDPNTRV